MMALRAAPTRIDALRGSTGRGRRLDRRTRDVDLEMELRVRHVEAEGFANRVRLDTYRISRLLDGELVIEAQRVADVLYHDAAKVIRRLSGDAA